MTALELTEPVAITERGVYDIPEETYHRDPVPGGSLSCSGAKLLLPPSCPAKYAYARTQPPPATDAMEFGSAAHHEVLGTGWPYVVCDFAENYRTKEAQEWAAETRAAGNPAAAQGQGEDRRDGGGDPRPPHRPAAAAR